jgi:hypothetical protein
LSDTSLGPDWWQASDGKWYPPHLHPDVLSGQAAAPAMGAPAMGAPAMGAPAAGAPVAVGPPGPGWWLASDGRWYPPHLRSDRAHGGGGSGALPRDDLIAAAPGQRSLRVRLGLDRTSRVLAIVAAVVVLAGGGVGIAIGLGSGGVAVPSKVTASTSTVASAVSTTIAPVAVTKAGVLALDFTLDDLPNGWANVDPGNAPQSNLVPTSSCDLARGFVAWSAVSPTFADSPGATADEIAFDSVTVSKTDAGASASLAFAESPTYENTCLHPVVIDAIQPYVGDPAATNGCRQDLDYGGDQITTNTANFDGAPADVIHWVGDYECPTNQKVSFMYVDEIVMAAGSSLENAFWIDLDAAPSGATEQKAMDDLATRAADHGL